MAFIDWDTFNWAAVEAIGVVFASVVALGLALWPAFWKWHTRPRPTLKVSGIEPHCVPIPGKGTVIHESLLRVEVYNGGKRAAHNLIAKVTEIWIQDLPLQDGERDLFHIGNAGPGEWRLRQSEPGALEWAAGPSVTISQQASEFVSLVRLRRNDMELTLCLDNADRSLIRPRASEASMVGGTVFLGPRVMTLPAVAVISPSR